MSAEPDAQGAPAERSQNGEQPTSAQSYPPQNAEAYWSRPSGNKLIVGGWWLIGIGLSILAIGLLAPIYSTEPNLYTQEPGVVNVWKWPLIWAGIGLANTGLLLWCVGEIQKALWFLPGRERQ